MVGPAFARHARTDSPRGRGGEMIFTLGGPPAGRSLTHPGTTGPRGLRVEPQDQGLIDGGDGDGLSV